MGNLIYSQDFITVSDGNIAARSTTAGYAKVDVMDYWHLKARHRAADLTASNIEELLVFDFGSSEVVEAVYLSDVNYDTVRIYGDDADLSSDWSTADFDSGNVTISQNDWTGRYQVYIPLTSFEYQFLTIVTPAAASAVGPYTTFWETGNVCILQSVTTLSTNIGYPIKQWTEELFVDVGRSGRVSVNDVTGWMGEITLGARTRTDETEAQLLGRMSKSEPILVYLNQSDTSEAYLCLMDQGYSSDWFTADLVQSSSAIRFREIIGA